MARKVICADPAHQSRKGQSGWSDSVGERPNMPPGPPVIIDGLYCGACGAVWHANHVAFQQVEREKKLASYAKIISKLGLTEAEARDMFAEYAALKG